MKIATKLKLAAWVPAFMAVVIGLALFFSYNVVQEAQEKDRTAQRIINGMHELNSQVQHYMLHREEQPRKQFLREHDSITRLIGTVRFGNPDHQKLLDDIRQDSEWMRSSFLKLVSEFDRPGSQQDPPSRKEAEDGLAGQILSRSRDVASIASKLERLIDDEITTTQRRINILIFFVFIATTFPLTVVLIRMMRNTRASLATLHKGTEVVAAGNLSHRIGIEAEDEIAELSRAFDDMTEQLRVTTVSRDVLSQEVEKRKQMEEALRRSRDELELRVRERTVALERSNKALQDFASIASHDLQEPLRKVSAFGNRIKERYGDSLGEEGKDFLERMLNASNRMESLLQSLLAYSRVTIKEEPFRQIELAGIVHEVLADLEVRIEKTEAEVRVGDLPVVSADPAQMRQLFQNLIGNALKFHKEGEKPLVEVRSDASVDGMFRIHVEDNGIGFDDKYLDRIFAPFQRLHGRTSPYEGTGMGLAICKKIVERHGGSITARSAPGQGAIFVITIPEKLRPVQSGPQTRMDTDKHG